MKILDHFVLLVVIPSFTYIKTYTWNGGTNGLVNLSSGAWSIKVYAWK
jgi:hypothetical protein